MSHAAIAGSSSKALSRYRAFSLAAMSVGTGSLAGVDLGLPANKVLQESVAHLPRA